MLVLLIYTHYFQKELVLSLKKKPPFLQNILQSLHTLILF